MPRKSPVEAPEALKAEFIGFRDASQPEGPPSRARHGEPASGNLFSSSTFRRAYGHRSTAVRRSPRWRRRLVASIAVALLGLTTLMTASGSEPHAKAGVTQLMLR